MESDNVSKQDGTFGSSQGKEIFTETLIKGVGETPIAMYSWWLSRAWVINLCDAGYCDGSGEWLNVWEAFKRKGPVLKQASSRAVIKADDYWEYNCRLPEPPRQTYISDGWAQHSMLNTMKSEEEQVKAASQHMTRTLANLYMGKMPAEDACMMCGTKEFSVGVRVYGVKDFVRALRPDDITEMWVCRSCWEKHSTILRTIFSWQ